MPTGDRAIQCGEARERWRICRSRLHLGRCNCLKTHPSTIWRKMYTELGLLSNLASREHLIRALDARDSCCADALRLLRQTLSAPVRSATALLPRCPCQVQSKVSLCNSLESLIEPWGSILPRVIAWSGFQHRSAYLYGFRQLHRLSTTCRTLLAAHNLPPDVGGLCYHSRYKYIHVSRQCRYRHYMV